MASIYAVPGATAREENMIIRFSELYTEYLRLRVKKLTLEASIPTKGSKQAAGHDLYAQETKVIPPNGQGFIGTGIANGLLSGTYGQVAPRSRLAAKYSLTVNTGVLDADYPGEVKVVLVSLGTKDYKIDKEDKIGQLIEEKVLSEEVLKVEDIEKRERGEKGFGSGDQKATKTEMMTKQSSASAELLTNQSWKVTGRSDTQDTQNQHLKEAESG